MADQRRSTAPPSSASARIPDPGSRIPTADPAIREVPPRPLVSVVMPVRNEGAAIEASLGSVLSQCWPADRLEVLIADGMSTDDTRARIDQLAAAHPAIAVMVLDNPGRIVATGLNAALARARGDVILRVDGHCEIAPDTIERSVEALAADERIGAVGGMLETVGEGLWGRIVAVAMSSRFGVGGSAFRIGAATTVDTDSVAFPAWRREALEAVGGFDEELVRNQDDEHNYRLRSRGWRVVLDPRIRSRYASRPSLAGTWRQLFGYGFWKVRVLQKHPRQMRARQFAPALLTLGLLGGGLLALLGVLLALLGGLLALLPWAALPLVLVGAAWLVAAVVAAVIESRRLGLPAALLLPLAFATLHLGYGCGMLVGMAAFANRWGDRVGSVPRGVLGG